MDELKQNVESFGMFGSLKFSEIKHSKLINYLAKM